MDGNHILWVSKSFSGKPKISNSRQGMYTITETIIERILKSIKSNITNTLIKLIDL